MNPLNRIPYHFSLDEVNLQPVVSLPFRVEHAVALGDVVGDEPVDGQVGGAVEDRARAGLEGGLVRRRVHQTCVRERESLKFGQICN